MSKQSGSKQWQSEEGERRQSFCQLQALLGNPREAAVQAGYPPSRAVAAAARLMADAEIIRQIDSYRQAAVERNIAHEALGGLHRLAFGAVNDALFLTQCEPDALQPDMRALDFFNVSEIEMSKSGSYKIKFFDRLSAMQALLAHTQPGEEASSGSLYQALVQGAQRWGDGGGQHEE